MTTYHIQVGESKGDYPGFVLLSTALADAYAAARFHDQPVTVLQADGPDDDLTFTPLAVISALPIVSAVSS